MNTLFVAVLLIAIAYAAVQTGGTLITLVLIGVLRLTRIVRNITITLLLKNQRKRIKRLIKGLKQTES